MDDDEVERLIAAELTRRNWSLASQAVLFDHEDSFIQRVKACAGCWRVERQLPDDAALVRSATVHEYCRLLHTAVSRNGSQVQSIALQESIDYAWPAALRRCPDREIAERALFDAVQEVWRHAAKIEPGNYLAYLAQVVQHELSRGLRKQKKVTAVEVASLDAVWSEQGEETDALAMERLAALASSDAERVSDVEWHATRATLLDLISRCLKNAHKEFIIHAHYFADLTLSEIARLLEIAVAQVHQGKFRALRQLRKCSEVIAALETQVNW